jgi:hypothetical protein
MRELYRLKFVVFKSPQLQIAKTQAWWMAASTSPQHTAGEPSSRRSQVCLALNRDPVLRVLELDQLCCANGPGGQREIPLDKSRITLGRDAGHADVVVDDKTKIKRISRLHAEVTLSPGGSSWQIVDLGSVNGMAVNGVKRSSATVTSRDLIQLIHSVSMLQLYAAHHSCSLTVDLYGAALGWRHSGAWDRGQRRRGRADQCAVQTRRYIALREGGT